MSQRRNVIEKKMTLEQIAKIRLVAVTLLVLSCLGACVIPYPQNHDIGRAVTVDPLTIKVGETTKNNVIERLGEPDAIWIDERIFAYSWVHVSSGVVVIIAGAGGAGFVWAGDAGGSHELLLIQFDPGNLVQRVDRTQKPSGVGMGEFLRAWAKGGTNAKS